MKIPICDDNQEIISAICVLNYKAIILKLMVGMQHVNAPCLLIFPIVTSNKNVTNAGTITTNQILKPIASLSRLRTSSQQKFGSSCSLLTFLTKQSLKPNFYGLLKGLMRWELFLKTIRRRFSEIVPSRFECETVTTIFPIQQDSNREIFLDYYIDSFILMTKFIFKYIQQHSLVATSNYQTSNDEMCWNEARKFRPGKTISPLPVKMITR